MPCDRACARARGQERTRQRMDDNFSEPMSWYDLLLILLPFLFLPPVLSLLAAYPTLLIRVYAVFAGSSSLACKRQRVPSSVCFRECLRRQGKNVPSLSAMSFLSGIRGILTRTISRARARARDVQKANRVLKLTRTTGRTNSESQVGPKSSKR